MHITVDSVMEAIKKDPTVLKAIVKDDVAEGQRIDAQAIAETVSESVWSLKEVH